jgi:ABC-type branched-subunit amino acid transport system substrate-binding protein
MRNPPARRARRPGRSPHRRAGGRRVRRLARLLASLTAVGTGLTAPTLAAAQDAVAIGLVVPGEGPQSELAAAARDAAETAIAAANREGGYRGRPFVLRIVAEDGLWGQGLARVVSLAFDDPVWGVIGGFDGRSAHLIQQVIIKARIPFLTPWATDPTLSRGRIAWFFQLVPDDRQQAEAIVAGADTVLVIADTTYDGRHFADAVVAAGDAAGAVVRRVDTTRGADGLGGASSVVADAGGDVRVVLATGPAAAVGLLDRAGAAPRPPTVHVPLRLASGGVRAASLAYPGRVLTAVIPPTPSVGTDARPRERSAPDAAAYTREAVEALVAAIREAGLDHWRIRDALAARTPDDAPGPAFDDAGRRHGRVLLVPVTDRDGGGGG